MKIDAWTHMLSPAYVERLEATGAQGPGAFLLSQRVLHDVDARLRALDAYGDYRQILTPIPHAHGAPGLGGRDLVEIVRRNNDELAGIVARHPERFAGFAAGTPIADPDAATEEAIRAVDELGALGVQLEVDPVNVPLHEDRYDPLFAAMAQRGAGVWLHPSRTPATPGLPPETASLLVWQIFGWPFDTTIVVARLIFAGVYDRHPTLKLIAHHGGGLIAQFSGRVQLMPTLTTMDVTGEAIARLHKPPGEYLRMLYVDTALFGAPHAVRSIVDFFGSDHVLFGTDTPFDSQAGAHFIPATIADVERVVPSPAARAAVFAGNASRLLGAGG